MQQPDDGHLTSNEVDDSMFIFPKKDQHSTNVSPTRPETTQNPGLAGLEEKFIYQKSNDLSEMTISNQSKPPKVTGGNGSMLD